MRRLVLSGLAAAAVGCAPPFAEVKPSAPRGGVALVYCGSAATSPESVMKALEPPSDLPPEVGGGGGVSAQKELRVCLRLLNRGAEVVRLDRSYVTLRCPGETDDWAPDRDDQLVIAHPGETRELHVAFRYSPLVHGEEVTLLFDRALTVGGKPARLGPVVLRKN
jgi:hypothetical protein